MTKEFFCRYCAVLFQRNREIKKEIEESSIETNDGKHACGGCRSYFFSGKKIHPVKERQVTMSMYASCHANPERNMLNFRDVLFFKVDISSRSSMDFFFIDHSIPLNRS